MMIFYLITLLIVFLTRFGFIDESLRSLFAALYVYALPLCFSLNIYLMRKKEDYVYWLLITLLFEFGFFALISYLSRFTSYQATFISDAIFTTTLLIIILFMTWEYIAKLKTKNPVKNNQTIIHVPFYGTLISFEILVGIATFCFFILYRKNTPLPYIVNWDFLHHTNLIRQLADGRFNLLLSNISDTFTFNSYVPFFHTLITIPSLLFKANILQTLWFVEFFHYLSTTAVSYWIGSKIIGGKWGGVLSALVSLFIFESQVAYTSLYFLPQTLAGIIGSLLLVYIITKKEQSLSSLVVFLGCVVVFLTHFIIGSVFIVLTGAIYLYKKFHLRCLNYLFLICSIIFFLVSLYLSYTNHRFFLTGQEDAKNFIYTFNGLKSFIWQWYSFLPLIFIPIGIYYFFKNIKNSNQIIIYIFFSLSALVLLPFSYSLKFYVLDRYFVNLVIAAGIWQVISQFNKPLWQMILIILISLGLCSILYSNINAFLQLSYNGKQNSYVSDSDFQASSWIQTYYRNQKVFLISDPTTQGVFEALAGINTQGGAFPTRQTIEKITFIDKVKNYKKVIEILTSIQDVLPDQNKRDVTLLIFGGRYFTWQKYAWECKISYACQTWLPQKIQQSDLQIINNMADSKYFKLVYIDEENAVFEINNNRIK